MNNELALKVENINVKFKFTKSRSIKKELIGIILFWRKGKKYEFNTAVKNISFEVKKGEKFGIIGSNGSGKTTLLRTIAGIYRQDSGNVERCDSKIALLSLGTGFKKDLNGIQNIYINALLLGMPINEIKKNIKDIIEYSELGRAINHPVKTYSSGMRARLAFSIAVYNNPDILLIDEALGVGDAKFKKKSNKKVSEMIHSGKTVIIVSHRLAFIEKLCDRVLWLEKGNEMMLGKSSDVVSAYEEQI